MKRWQDQVFFKDIHWKKIAELIETEETKSNYSIWDQHKKDWEIYCMNCTRSVWLKCIIDKKHTNHDLVEYDDPVKAKEIVKDLQKNSAYNDKKL